MLAQRCFYLLLLKDMGIALKLFKLSQILSLIYRTKYNLSDIASFFVWILSVSSKPNKIGDIH
jgi:hypothetical protein